GAQQHRSRDEEPCADARFGAGLERRGVEARVGRLAADDGHRPPVLERIREGQQLYRATPAFDRNDSTRGSRDGRSFGRLALTHGRAGRQDQREAWHESAEARHGAYFFLAASTFLTLSISVVRYVDRTLRSCLSASVTACPQTE